MPEPGQILRFEPDGSSSWQDPPRKPQNPYVTVRVRLRRETYQDLRSFAKAKGYTLADMLGGLIEENGSPWEED
jgi:hypothetical protein